MIAARWAGTPDYMTKVETLSLGINARILSPNEAREKLGMNPYEGGDNYENPAITPGATGDGSEDAETDEQMTPEDASRGAIVAHLRHMIGVEAKHVINAAGNKRNYIGWLDQFYSDDKWNKTIHRSIEEMGGNMEITVAHLNQSKTELMEIARTVHPDGLADAICETVSHWPVRAEALADAITGELAHA